MAEGAVSNLPPTAVIKIAMEALSGAGFPMMLLELVSASDPDQLLHRAYYYHPADIASHAEPIWSKGRVVLAGDAAHGMPPFTAQGANQGFEDAAILGTLLAETINQKLAEDPDSLAHVYRHYEQIRRPFMVEMQAAVLRSQDWSQEEWENYNERVYLRDFGIPLLA
jgi:2-polyprenyl-6-methoxyphenol hydroxylase-like FAD-dependent oxidoreductase